MTDSNVAPAAANYVQVGRWMRCAHCGTVNEGGRGSAHYCGAPWQTPAADLPDDEWVTVLQSPTSLEPFEKAIWDYRTAVRARLRGSQKDDRELSNDEYEKLTDEESASGKALLDLYRNPSAGTGEVQDLTQTVSTGAASVPPSAAEVERLAQWAEMYAAENVQVGQAYRSTWADEDGEHTEHVRLHYTGRARELHSIALLLRELSSASRDAAMQSHPNAASQPRGTGEGGK